MSTKPKFRKLSMEDLSEMMAVERESFAIAWSATMMRDSLQAAHCQSWGIFNKEGDMVGFGILSVVFDEAEILSMGIRPRFQRKGFGVQLADFLMERARAAKAAHVMLEVREGNIAAIDLYKKKGWEQYGVRKGYYPTEQPGVRENALLMRVSL